MNTQTVSESKTFLTRIWLFVQGAVIGGVFYVILAFLATSLAGFLLQRDESCILEYYRLNPYASAEPCVPKWVFALLLAISWGPGTVFWFFLWPGVSEKLGQVISGLILSGLAGIAFLITGRKRGIVIFLLFYILTTALSTFIFLLVSRIV